ncbi:helix-turn-helix domain-containing protein [Algoriphagus sp. AGSA1]|uniref:helix-turn-helix domain-containing protein n=1 Tax=Algoriphagus sp. AGSA1 TaxID=2907213 RepID=UPI00279574B1|nr:helix-turn-helix domain-containing protein [Algoriphagus sp. AGSA1]MCE7057315.1 helix-turn-helix domain-containing protein [Algoriphagus sp. AGSA1]
MLTVRTYWPKALSPLIKSFWYLKVSEDLRQPYIEEILPDLHHEMVFQLNAAQTRKKAGSSDWVKDPETYFAGQNSKSYKNKFSPGAVIYGIRFHPHTQALFYSFPAVLNTDNPISIADVTSGDILPGCIAESPEKTFANFEKELIKKASRIQGANAPFQYVDTVIKKIFEQKGNIRISSLEKITGVSDRYLEKTFKKYVGLSPKQFCNMVRFNHFVQIRKKHPDMQLTECAYQAEFYDQSHLIRQSHLITGKSPKDLFSNSDQINEHFLGD